MSAPSELAEYTLEEVAKHNTTEDCWLIIGEPGQRLIYDVTPYLDDHPGGPEIILDLAGQNATEEFEDIGHSSDARKTMQSIISATSNTTPAAVSSQRNTLALLIPLLAVLVALYMKYLK